MNLIDVLRTAASQATTGQRQDGSMPSGHNGPYRDPETPVRCTAHWLVTLSWLAQRDPSGPWQTPARAALRYLLAREARPEGHAFVQRQKVGKDRCNGLIGAAWVFEGLCAAADRLGEDEATAVAETIYFRHPFDPHAGLWRVYEVDGQELGFDPTFNHQLWFAAAAAAIHGPRRNEVLAHVARFLDRLDRNLVLRASGLIHHAMPRTSVATDARSHVRALIKQGIEDLPFTQLHPRVKARRADLQRKSVGYHAFNLHALGMLREQLPSHPFWSGDRLRAIVDYASSPAYREGLEANPYAYPYNPPGFEVPYGLHALAEPLAPEVEAACHALLREQIVRTWDPSAGALSRNNPDPITMTARLYEATRLPERFLTAELARIPGVQPRAAGQPARG